MRSTHHACRLAIAALFAAALPTIAAAAPVRVPYTGTLQVNNSGDVAVTIQAKLFDSNAQNATAVWPPANGPTALYPGVQLRGGRFSITLGDTGDAANPRPALEDTVISTPGRELWLELTVTPAGGQPTVLRPRQRLLAVPYAVDAGSAQVLAEIALVRSEVAASREFHVGERPPFQGGVGVPQTGQNWTPLPADKNPTLTMTPRADGKYRFATSLYVLGNCAYVRIRVTGNGATPLANSPFFVCGTGGGGSAEAYYHLLGNVQYTADVQFLTPDADGGIGQNGETRMVGYRVE